VFSPRGGSAPRAATEGAEAVTLGTSAATVRPG
jgi:hypothetical protein